WALGQHQTGHNSGVIHSGLYYAPGSMKARTCVAGSAALMRLCEERGIPFERCGKVIVATEPSELPRLEELYRRGLANGVQGLELIGPERLRELEPHVVGLRALWSPNTGIVDYPRVAASYAEELRAMGAEIRVSHRVLGVRRGAGGALLETTGGEIEAHTVVACAGLHADRVAALSGAPPDPRIVPFRGDYYVLRPERRHLVRNLVYPVPDPAFPFLGVHFTRRLDGEVWLGPNAVLAFAREGYRLADVDLRDLAEVLAFPGFRKLAAKYWKVGLAEMVRDVSRRAFLDALRRYVPELEPADLRPGPSGVRAQALDREGKLVDDFVVHHVAETLHVRNAPSPGATSSLAIGALIADALEGVGG
ncbi:MAG: L-2-hydroxyglutarate oxidase, partial [Chloroflexi bacterium]|nr:L-2-hydroxyglutarate oxidase [Chloroflexota bacterium]